MKKLLLLMVIAGLFLTLAINGQTGMWIKTADGQVNCKKVAVFEKNTKLVLDNGEKKEIPTSTVLSYFKDDKLFMKIPLYTKGVKGDPVFMEFVRSRDDMYLYKYNNRYFVYKGDNFYIELLDDNRADFEKFFNM